MIVTTLACPNCGCVFSGRLLYREKAIACIGPGCSRTHRFADLPERDRERVRDAADGSGR